MSYTKYSLFIACTYFVFTHIIINNASEKNAKPLMKKTYFNWIKTCCFAGYLQYLIDFRKQLQMIRWLYSFLKMISITNRFCNLVELLTLPRKLFKKRDITILYLLDIWETLNIQKLLKKNIYLRKIELFNCLIYVFVSMYDLFLNYKCVFMQIILRIRIVRYRPKHGLLSEHVP